MNSSSSLSALHSPRAGSSTQLGSSLAFLYISLTSSSEETGIVGMKALSLKSCKCFSQYQWRPQASFWLRSGMGLSRCKKSSLVWAQMRRRRTPCLLLRHLSATPHTAAAAAASACFSAARACATAAACGTAAALPGMTSSGAEADKASKVSAAAAAAPAAAPCMASAAVCGSGTASCALSHL